MLTSDQLQEVRAAVGVLQRPTTSGDFVNAQTTILRHAEALLAMAEAAAQHRCPVAWDQPITAPIVFDEARPLWVEYRERWLAAGFDIHAYHGFKAGPLPGCNTMYGDTQCKASIDEHCHCGSGEHLALDKAHASQ